MSSSMESRSDGCAQFQELVAWLPTTTMAESERRQVEEHAAACGSCAEMLRFSREIKAGLAALAAVHPGPETLVRFVDAGAGATPLGKEERSHIEAHLTLCSACRDEVAILGEVEAEYAQRTIPLAARRGWLTEIGDRLAGSVLRPLPAAVYLAAAMIAIGMLITRPAPRTSPGLKMVPGEQRVGGVVLLPDAASRLRGSGDAGPMGPVLTAAEDQFLLLEFMDLEKVPGPDDHYRISLLREGAQTPIREDTVAGSRFRDNYTLYFQIPARSLPAGDYAVSVAGPGDTTIFSGPFSVR